MKKILSLLLSVAIVLSCVSMVVFAVDGPQSENLLPAEISTFDEGGVTSHEHMGNSVDANRFGTPAIIDGAFRIGKVNAGWVETAAAPTWILSPYIKAFAAENPAESYLVSVSMDVKGDVGTTSLIFRGTNVGNQWGLKYFESATFTADSFTTVSGSVEMTAAQISEASATGNALCLENIALGATVYFDNITLKIKPKGIAVPDEPVGLLPTEISTFGSNGVTSHANMGFIGESNRFGAPSIVDGAYFIQKVTGGWVEGYASPAWYLAPYIKEFANANPANEYIVSVSVDVKGTIGTAPVVLRNSNASNADVNAISAIGTSAVATDAFTTISGTVTLTAAQIADASASSYALCFNNFNAGTNVYIDNIALNVEAVKAPDPIGLLPVEISVFDKVGVTSHANMGFIGESNRFGTPSIVDGAYFIQKQTGSWVESYAAPVWYLAPYIKEFANANPANEYIVSVSVDVKGTIGTAPVVLRNSNASNANAYAISAIGSSAITTDAFTTISGTVTLTAAQIAEASATSYALCFENFNAGTNAYIDNIALNVEAVKAPDPIGLLPVEISVFDKVGVTSHANMGFIGESNRFGTPSIVDGAYFIQKQTGSWVESYAAPVWYLAPYIKEYAAANASSVYLVEISMDVKGTLGSAKMVLRNSNASDVNAYGISSLNTADVTADAFTTISGTVVLTAAQIAEATATSYALCFENINAGSTVYIDNIAVNVTPIESNAIEGATLDIGSTLTLNYYADLDDEHKDAVLVVTRNDKTVEINGVYDETYGMYKFAYAGINPQCMTDNISASLKLDGEEISAKAEYSVKDYFVNVYASTAAELGITDDKYTALIKLANDTLVFGAEAQKYMNYNLAELATDDVEWIGKDVTAITAPVEIFKSINNTDANNKVASATLSISNTVTVMYRVKLTDTALTVKVNGTVAELVPAGNANEYFVYAPDATATEFNKPYTITITDGETEISKVSYSVNDYIAFVAAKGEGSALYDIVRALNNYGISAVAFKNA